MKTAVLICDDNEEYLKEATAALNSDETEVVGAAKSGKEALAEIATLHPDVLVLDLVMPEEDGFSVLEKIPDDVRVIVVSALNRETFISKATALGADYYMTKPVNFKLLSERIRDAVRPKARLIKNKIMDEKISNIFITVGIPAHIKGYQYLREAIKMTVENPDIINSITKRLYPEVAEHFNTSASKVERAIRHAIEVAWSRGKIENINQLFGVRVYSHNEKPTNGEFIALVADKMLMEQA